MKASADLELAHFVRDYLAGHQRQMLAVLEAFVRAESPTERPEAQAEIQKALTRILHSLGYGVLRERRRSTLTTRRDRR